MSKRALVLIVAEDREARLHAALSLAAAASALGRKALVFFQAEAVALAKHDARFAGDTERALFGAATIVELFESCLDLGVELYACQTGLYQQGMTHEELRAGVEPSGLVAVLQLAPEAELLIA
jgi:predicted peroxiredoxin